MLICISIIVKLKIGLGDAVIQKIILVVEVVAEEEVLKGFDQIYLAVVQIYLIGRQVVISEAHMSKQCLFPQNKGLRSPFILVF